MGTREHKLTPHYVVILCTLCGEGIKAAMPLLGIETTPFPPQSGELSLLQSFIQLKNRCLNLCPYLLPGV